MHRPLSRPGFDPATIIMALLALPAGAAPSRAAEAGSAPGPLAAVSVRIEPERVTIENAFLSIELPTPDGRVRTASVTNRGTGASTSFVGEDFVLVLAGGEAVRSGELALGKVAEEPAAGGGRRVTFDVARDDLRVRYLVELRPEDWWASRWLEVRGGKGMLEKVSLSEWRVLDTWGPPGPGRTVEGLGYSQGHGQAAYVDDLFFAIAHPAAESFARGKRIACRATVLEALPADAPLVTPRFLLGVGEAGGAPQAFWRCVAARRAAPPRQTVLLFSNDAGTFASSVRAAGEARASGGPPIDAVLLAGAWDLRDEGALPWAALDPARLPGGEEALAAALAPTGTGLALRFDPTGGAEGKALVAAARRAGLDVGADRACVAGVRTRKHLADCFAAWAARGAVAIEVDGLAPECSAEGHGHPVGPGAAIARMEAVMEAARAGRTARPGILVGYLSGSNPSPFWLEHLDWVSPGGAEASIGPEPIGPEPSSAGALDAWATAIDARLQAHRATEMPASAFAVVDLAGHAAASASDESFERNAWWLVARTSLRHAWHVREGDLTPGRWATLGKAVAWGRSRERLFRLGRMVGGDPARGGIYGFSAFEEGAGVLALRNPSGEPETIERTLSSLLWLSRAASKKTYRLTGVFGETRSLEGSRQGRSIMKVELPPFAVGIVEAKEE